MLSVKVEVIILVIGTVMSVCFCAINIKTSSSAMGYLKRFGYLDEQDNPRYVTKDEEKAAIMKFQKMAGVKITGFLDTATMYMMNRPRCGMRDTANAFVTATRWPKKTFIYVITKYPRNTLTKQQVDEEIARAFKVWSDFTDLTFRAIDRARISDYQVDIDIRFEIGDHGDGGRDNAFDGPSGTLAHAYYPTNGRAHFDDEERWTVRTSSGTNLFQVAAHEFGHALGLGHSEVHAALMAPYYMGYVPNFRLHTDDIQGIQKLYGPKSTKPPPRPASSPATTCEYPAFDTIFTDLKGVTYVIKGSRYWQSGSVGVPRDLKIKWAGLPGKVDAAFSHREIGKTYIFSGAYFWRYQEETLDRGYPKLIAAKFPGIPDNIDAALVWPRNNQIYFFKGREFWKYDYTRSPPVASTYPRQILTWWRGVPDSLDAAFTWGGLTYFAKGGSYFQFDDRAVSTTSRGEIGHLFGCQDGPVLQSRQRPVSMPRALTMPLVTESMAKPNAKKCTSSKKCAMP